MEDLIREFTQLSYQAMHDKNFDPSSIEDLMKLFDVEAYRSWACLEQECTYEAESAQDSLDSAEEELNTAMQDAMHEFRMFEEEMEREGMGEFRMLEEEMEREGMGEYHSLISASQGARMMGLALSKAATIASNHYIQTALASATNSMKSAWKGISKPKVHPC